MSTGAKGSDPHVRKKAVVIGAGVVGSGVALELVRRGWDVTILDRGHAPGYGSTAASSAVIRFTYSTYAGAAMAYEGVEYWRNWAEYVRLPDDRPLTRFVQSGMAFFDDPSGYAQASRKILEDVGVTYEFWDADELARRVPAMTTASYFPPTPIDDPAFFDEPTGRLGGAVFTPEGGYVTDPQLAAQNLADAAVAEGATLRCRAEVVAVHAADGRVRCVELADGTRIEADVVVNAAGPHSPLINAMAGVLDGMNVKTRPLRQQVEHVRAPEGLRDVLMTSPSICDLDSGIYFRSDGDALLVGGTEADCDPLVWLDDPDDVDLDLRLDEWETKTLRLARRIPELGVPPERRGVVGVYDVADDWRPIIDRSDLDGFYLAIGTSGNQFKNGPIIGHCLAEMIGRIEAGEDHDANPIVVKGPYRGLDIDMATFSRRRAINDDGPRGVIG